MRDSFPRGLPGAGPQGDPGPDALLTEEVAELLLDGWPRRGALSPDLRQLRETVDALRAGPSRSELRAESLMLAAFRDIRGASLDDTIVDGTPVDDLGLHGSRTRPAVIDEAGPAGAMAHTLRLEIPSDPAGARPGRAKHRGRPEGRPAGRPGGLPRPVVRRPRAVGTIAAVALLAIIGVFAYAGSLPGPIQNAAHDAFGAPPVKTSSASAPSEEVTGSARASASPMTGAREVRPSTTSGPQPSANVAPAGPKQWCQAYFSNPWKPGSTSWDKSDFEKLARAAPGGPAWVLWYCSKYVDVRHEIDSMTYFFPAGFPGSSWAWTPDHGQGRTPGYPDGDSGTGSTPRSGTFPGQDGGPGPANVSGQAGSTGQAGSSGRGEATPPSPAGAGW